MGAGRTFAEQAREQRAELDRQATALEYIAEIEARAEQSATNAQDRSRGGALLDPVDPTRVNLPVVWLRALLAQARHEGYGSLSNSDGMRGLIDEWNASFHRDDDEVARLRSSFPDLADALVKLMDQL